MLGMLNGAASMENSTAIPKKIKIELTMALEDGDNIFFLKRRVFLFVCFAIQYHKSSGENAG